MLGVGAHGGGWGGDESPFSCRHLHRCALTPGETHNLACLPPSELSSQRGRHLRMASIRERGGEKGGSSGVAVRERRHIAVYSEMENVSYKQSRDLLCGQIVFAS